MILFAADSVEHACYDDIRSVRMEGLAVDDDSLRQLIERIVEKAEPLIAEEFEEQIKELKAHVEELEAAQGTNETLLTRERTALTEFKADVAAAVRNLTNVLARQEDKEHTAAITGGS